MQRRVLLRLIAVALALVGVIVYPPLEKAWHGWRSPCAKAWRDSDVAALAGGTWERGALYHCDYFCDESFGEPGSSKYTAFLDVNRDVGGSEADRWLKTLRDVKPLSQGVVTGTDERQDRVAVMRRPKGGIRITLEHARFTDEHLKHAVEQLTAHLPDLDRYLATE